MKTKVKKILLSILGARKAEVIFELFDWGAGDDTLITDTGDDLVFKERG